MLLRTIILQKMVFLVFEPGNEKYVIEAIEAIRAQPENKKREVRYVEC